MAGALLTSTGALRIGGNSIWGEFFQGRIDEVRVYNRALSAGELQTDMNTPLPSTGTSILRFVGNARGPVNLAIGPGGDLFYADFDGGTVRRVVFNGANNPPVAAIQATPTSGAAPLAVQFSAAGSSDPDGDALTYSWDLNGDGVFGDSTLGQPGVHLHDGRRVQRCSCGSRTAGAPPPRPGRRSWRGPVRSPPSTRRPRR